MSEASPVPHRTMGNLNDAWAAIAALEELVTELKAQVEKLSKKQ